MLKKIYNKIKTSIWLYPMLYSLFALLLSMLVTAVDRLYAQEVGQYVHGIFFTSSALAQSVLGIVASSFITIATFTFSTTMIVLTMYSSQFTPRVVENFLNNQTTMKSFGVFLSGFIYAVTALLFIDKSTENNLVISASIGVVYVIVGLVYFLLFIHNVSTHIQANGLIERLYKEALNKINHYLDFIKSFDVMTLQNTKAHIEKKNSFKICSNGDGYIQEINYHKLNNYAKENECIISVEKVVGQFVSKETDLITIYYLGELSFKEEEKKTMQQCFILGNKKTETQDFSFTIQKIVEIAVKSLSPGINDPNTCNHCLKNIGLLLRDLGTIEYGYIVYKNIEDDEDLSLFIEAYDFERILYDAYHQISHYGQDDASVVISIFKSLRIIKGKATPLNIDIILEYGQYLFDKVTFLKNDELSFAKIKNEYEDLIAKN